MYAFRRTKNKIARSIAAGNAPSVSHACVDRRRFNNFDKRAKDSRKKRNGDIRTWAGEGEDIRMRKVGRAIETPKSLMVKHRYTMDGISNHIKQWRR